MSGRRLLLAACVLAVSSCGDATTGTKIGNPTAQLRVEMTAWSSDESIAAVPRPQALTSGVVITRAILGVEEVRLVRALPDGTCPLTDDGLEIERAFTADIVAGTALTPIEVPKNERFCEFRLDLEEGADLPGTEHGALLGEAEILVEGTRLDGTPFVLRSDGVGEIRFRRTTPFSITADDSLWYLAFDVASWFSAVDLDTATVGQDGTIRIDEHENASLLAQFEAVVEDGADACDDDDDDLFDDDCDDDDD